MARFSEILAEVEASWRDAPASACFSIPLGLHAEPIGRVGSGLGEVEKTAGKVAAAYRQELDDDDDAPARRTAKAGPPRATFLTGLPDESELDCIPFESLRALRRKIAWMLHPDRTKDPSSAQAMARFNALIDAALMRKTAK